MFSVRASLAVVAGSLLFASGCVVAPQGGAEDDLAVADDAIIWTNGDVPSFFWKTTTQQALQRLAVSPLVNAATGRLTATPLLDTAEGRALLHYVVGCALPPHTTVNTSVPGVSLQGSIGLAPTWKTGKLGALSSQRWVTACLLQTLNGIGAHVPIRMVGSHLGLTDASAQDAVNYSIPDATMFGNIFDPAKVEVFACADAGAAAACGLSWSAFANLRICDASPLCGITLLGACQGEAGAHCSINSVGKPVCRTPGNTLYAEAISTFLDETGFVALYPSCSLPP